MTCQKEHQTCRECIQSGQAWGPNGGCSRCSNVSPCFRAETQCSEYDALQKARGVCEKQNSCVTCHEANSHCRWAAGTCTIHQKVFNSARGCPTSETSPVVTPPTTSSMCIDCIEGGGIWQAGECTQCEYLDSGYCYEMKESCSLWDLRAVGRELCPQQNSCSECLYAHPHCQWSAFAFPPRRGIIIPRCTASFGEFGGSNAKITSVEECPPPGAYVNSCCRHGTH